MGDESCLHFFEPQRKVSNKIWAMKSTKQPCIACRTVSVWKCMRSSLQFMGLLFRMRCQVVNMLCSAAIKCRQNSSPVFRNVGRKMYVKLRHDNAPSHKAAIVAKFLEHEKELPHPPYSPCDYFLFLRMKQMLAGKTIHVVLLWDQLFSRV